MQLITAKPAWLTARDMEILHRVFATVQCELGLARSSEAVALHFAERLPGVGAAFTHNEARNPILMYIAKGSGFPETLDVLCHEMVHVRQVVDGDLVSDDRGISWRGQLWTPDMLPDTISAARLPKAARKLVYLQYRALPWEQEAHDRQLPLLKSAMLKLPADDAQYVFRAALGELNSMPKAA